MKIKKLTLHTENLASTKDFYVHILGFLLINENEHSFQFKTGTSILEFTKKDTQGKPYYHFAFNIPPNKFKEAKSWLQNKVPLSLEDGTDEVNFSHLPANAIYFEDPSGNIVEFIARIGVNEDSSEKFSSNSIIDISEIGVIVDDVLQVGDSLRASQIFERDNKPLSEKFLNFMGVRDIGVFIILTRPGRRWFFSDKYSAIFPLKISVENGSVLSVDTNGEFSLQKGNL